MFQNPPHQGVPEHQWQVSSEEDETSVIIIISSPWHWGEEWSHQEHQQEQGEVRPEQHESGQFSPGQHSQLRSLEQRHADGGAQTREGDKTWELLESLIIQQQQQTQTQQQQQQQHIPVLPLVE